MEALTQHLDASTLNRLGAQLRQFEKDLSVAVGKDLILVLQAQDGGAPFSVNGGKTINFPKIGGAIAVSCYEQLTECVWESQPKP